jgi:hypothetical protein
VSHLAQQGLWHVKVSREAKLLHSLAQGQFSPTQQRTTQTLRNFLRRQLVARARHRRALSPLGHTVGAIDSINLASSRTGPFIKTVFFFSIFWPSDGKFSVASRARTRETHRRRCHGSDFRILPKPRFPSNAHKFILANGPQIRANPAAQIWREILAPRYLQLRYISHTMPAWRRSIASATNYGELYSNAAKLATESVLRRASLIRSLVDSSMRTLVCHWRISTNCASA